MQTYFGPCKLIWHYRNKQKMFDFMPNQTLMIIDIEVKRWNFDPFLLQQVLGREPTPDEQNTELSYSTAMRLECDFRDTDYGEEVAAIFVKRLSKDIKPKQLLLIPNYGFASKEQSMVFHRALPHAMSAGQIIFLLLPSDGSGEYARHGLKKLWV